MVKLKISDENINYLFLELSNINLLMMGIILLFKRKLDPTYNVKYLRNVNFEELWIETRENFLSILTITVAKGLGVYCCLTSFHLFSFMYMLSNFH